MAGLTAKNIAKPEEVREMKNGKGRVELVDLGSGLRRTSDIRAWLALVRTR